MRIVSQQRNMSFNFDSIELWTQDNYIYAKNGNDSKVIGLYKSEERTNEVFQDIHNAYSPVTMISSDMTDEEVSQFIGSVNVNHVIVGMNDTKNSEITIFDNAVYYMPEE